MRFQPTQSPAESKLIIVGDGEYPVISGPGVSAEQFHAREMRIRAAIIVQEKKLADAVAVQERVRRQRRAQERARERDRIRMGIY